MFKMDEVMTKMDSYMYGDFAEDVQELENTCCGSDYHTAMTVPYEPDYSFRRENLVAQAMPFFGGDNIDGLIAYVRKLEEFIKNG
jgi:hypothetical protein